MNKNNYCITKSECQKNIEEIYSIFNSDELYKINVDSSKRKIKFFLNMFTKFLIENKKNIKGYNYHHLKNIYIYFLQKGWITIYKPMELFLREYFPGEEITEWCINKNIKNGNRESIEYKVLRFNPEDIRKSTYKKEQLTKRKLANKLYNKGTIDGLLTFAKYNYSINKWDTNKQARKATIKVLKKANNPNDKLEAIILLLSHQVKVNYKFKSNFDIYKVINEVNKYKGYKNWMHCLHLIVGNLLDGYGCKIDIKKAKELFTNYSGYSLESIKDDNKFLITYENYYQTEYKKRVKELNLK